MSKGMLKRWGSILPFAFCVYGVLVLYSLINVQNKLMIPADLFIPLNSSNTPLAVPTTAQTSQSKSTAGSSPPQVSKTLPIKTTKRPLYSLDYLKGDVKVGDKYEGGFMTPLDDLCPNNGLGLKLMVFITSAPDHELQRRAIRLTWGSFHNRKDIAIAFVVGRTLNADVQTVIDKENQIYGDVIEAKFVDHYSNLTLKTVSIFQWLTRYCNEVKFILKTDDDMFINIPLLMALVENRKNDKRSLYGKLAKNWKPIRNKKSKYYIDTKTYSRSKYPSFLTGPAYLFTNDVVEDLYHHTLTAPFFMLEDVLIMGIVSESLSLKKVSVSYFKNEKMKLTDVCKLKATISIHMVKYDEQFDIYKKTLDGKTKCKKR